MNRRVLILGPTTPSVGGITTAVNALMGSSLATEFEVRRMANSNHRPTNEKGLVDAHNIASALVVLVRFVWATVLFRPRIVQVETAGGIGFLKQSVYILAARMMWRRVIVSLHCANEGEPLREFATGGRLGRWYCGRVLRMCDSVKLLSPRWKEEFAAHWGVDSARVIGVRNCLEASFPWGAAVANVHREGDFRVVCVGSVGERKGSFLLIEAARQLRLRGIPVSLALVGPEERAGGMDALATAARVSGVQDAVHLLGAQARGRALEELAKADVFALPSYAEGMPYSIIEAMAIGLPVVASDVGAVKDLIANDVNGLLIQAGSVDQLVDVLSRLASDSSLRQRLASQGREFARNEFGINRLESALRAQYERLVEREETAHA